MTTRQAVALVVVGVVLSLLVSCAFARPYEQSQQTEENHSDLDEIQFVPTPQAPQKVEGQVHIPLQDFLRLHEGATKPNVSVVVPPPRDFNARNTSIKGVTMNAFAALTVSYQIVVLKSGWTAIPLLNQQHTVVAHRIYSVNPDGSRVLVSSDGQLAQISTSEGHYTLLASSQGEYVVELELRETILSKSTKPNLTIFFAPGLNSITNLLEFEIPGQRSYVSLSPSVFVEITTPATSTDKDATNRGTFAKAYFPPTEELTIEWTVKEALETQETKGDGKKPVPTSMSVQQNVLYDINNDGFISIVASFNYGITLGKQSKFQIKFHDDVRILDVNGEAIDKWEINYAKTLSGKKDDTGKVLTIFLDRPMDREFFVRITAEMSSAFDLKKGNTTVEVDLPTFTALDARRENLILAVAASPFLEVTELKRDGGVVRIDPRELPGMGWSHGLGSAGHAVLFSYTSSTSSIKIPLELTKHKDVSVLPAIIESATLQSTFVTDRILHHLYLQIRNSQKQYLRVEIPDKEYEVWSTFVGGEPVKPSSDAAGVLLVPIKRDFRSNYGTRDNTFLVEIVYYAPAKTLEKEGDFELLLPKLDIPITQLYVQLNLPSTHTFYKFEGSDLQKRDQYVCDRTANAGVPPQPPTPRSGGGGLFGVQYSAVPMGQKAMPERRMKKAYMQQSMEGETGMLEAREMADEDAVFDNAVPTSSFSASSSASGGLDSGVLPVQIPALLVGDQHCFERMLVHEKNFLSLKAKYVHKDWQTIHQLLSWPGHLGSLGIAASVLGCVCLGLLAILCRARGRVAKKGQ